VAVEVHRHHGAHAAAGDAIDHHAGADLALPRQEVGDLLRIEAPRDRLDIEEHRMGARVDDGTGGGNEGQRGCQHLIVGADTGRAQRQVRAALPLTMATAWGTPT
jgi:hypothetical protein